MSILVDQIRACYAEIGRADSMRALLAVAEKCEQMRANSGHSLGTYNLAIADEFEQVIARELGIQP